jgi:DNA processing protein
MSVSNEQNQDLWKAEAVAFYALQSIKGVGFQTLYKVASMEIWFRELLKTRDQNHFQKMLRIKLDDNITKDIESWEAYQHELWTNGLDIARNLASQNIKVIFFRQDIYPKQLCGITEPPMWLFVQGALQNLNTPSVAIVGSRKSSEEGMWLTKYIIAALVGTSLVTVSGLADGIDQKAHIESMAFGIPTVAILGTGIDSNYPKGSEKIRNEILAKGGTVVSEYLLGQSYSAENFIRRNRIQAGLSNAVIPVEWKIKSGTAHTVGFAKKYQRHLLMPYLANAISIEKEKESISSYSKGMTFLVPNDSSQLIELMGSFTLNDIYVTNSANCEAREQLPFDLI